jgi:hypothetical protein
MIQILETVSAAGNVIERRPLPVIFDDEDQATAFIPNFLAIAFRDGRSGYDAAGDYWWGCEPHTVRFYRYTIENDLVSAAAA